MGDKPQQRGFAVGDRVRIRAKGRRIVGVVGDNEYVDGRIRVDVPWGGEKDGTLYFHVFPEQLIRVVKKAKPKPEEPKPPEVIWVPKAWHEANKADVRSDFNNLMDFLSEHGYPSTCHKYKLVKEGE